MDAVEPLLGKLVKIVYSDSGETKIRKGVLIAFDSTLLTVKCFEHTYAIARSQIVEVKTLEEARL